MRIKDIIVVFALLLSLPVLGQSELEELVKEGVQYHDNGDYDKAIETYEKALKINEKSLLVNYEIALSYFSNGNYKEVIKHSDIVIKQNDAYVVQAYITKGSALDNLGKTKESIKLFEKAIKTTKGNYLLYYNLALNFFKLNDLDKAEENVIKAIELNSNHSSSHLILAHVNNSKGNTVQTLLAIHYFLFLEPDTKRSHEAYQILQENFGGNVSKDENKPNTINITLSANNDSQFGAIELMVSMLEASKTLEENKGKTEEEMFVENTNLFFTVLGELKKKESKSIWWAFYASFFYDLSKSNHLETYCKYITQNVNDSAHLWLLENENKLTDFDNWLKNN